MIDALIAGKLHGAPTQRTGKNGGTFTTAKVRVPTGEDATFCNVIAFDQDAQAALLALGSGEAVALAGSLKFATWTDKSGATRPSLDLVASKALTQYSITKRRNGMVTVRDEAPARPSHDAWKARAPAERQPYRRGDYAADPGELDDDGDLPI
jgi:single-stranded DNA-binding protein